MVPRGARVVALAVCAVACLALPAAAGAGVQSDGYALVQDQPEPDNTVTRVELAENGSAVWTITLRTRLETEANVSEYERFQESFRENESRYLDPFRERMVGVVANANETSDREMGASGFAAETSIQEVPRRWGIVTFRFRWEGFAAVEGDRVVVGDVFDGGFFIGEDDALAVVAPPGYGIASVDPAPDESGAEAVEWTGREDFADDRPRVVATPEAAAGTAATESGGSESGGNGDGAGSLPIADGAVPVAVVLALVLIAALAAALAAARGGLLPLPSNRLGGTAESGDSAADGGAGATAGASRSGGGAGADGELLSDEDRVRNLLADSGGRLKQSAIAEELDWSKSKTSRVLSRMAEDGTVEKLRLGRENVIDLSDGEE